MTPRSEGRNYARWLWFSMSFDGPANQKESTTRSDKDENDDSDKVTTAVESPPLWRTAGTDSHECRPGKETTGDRECPKKEDSL